MAYSRQRELTLNTLKANPVHPTADELYGYIRALEPTISLATVYRNLHQLAERGEIMRIHVPDGADRYDPVNDGHHHMSCERCGRIEDIPAQAVPEICGEARRRTGLDIHSSRIMFYGVCNACKHLNNQ